MFSLEVMCVFEELNNFSGIVAFYAGWTPSMKLLHHSSPLYETGFSSLFPELAASLV